jgi:RNA polymerase sigma-70 factor (ECF subfamily)
MTISQVPNFSDLQLVECVVRHEADAFNEIYRRHVRSVTAISKMVLGNSSACEDVVAEVFLAFWLKPDSFDASRGSLLGFLRMKARGRSIDIIRTDVARRRREVTDCLASPRAVSHPDDDILKLGLAEQLHKALSSLIESEREPIELAFFTGMTYRDVANHLDLPEGTVKSRIRSGLHNARIIFDSELLAEAGT